MENVAVKKRKTPSKAKQNVISIAAPIIVFVAVFCIWELAVKVNDIQPWLLPGPFEIIASMVTNFGEIAPHLWVSFITILVGYVVAVPVGILVAALVCNYKLLSDTLSPYIIFLVTMPMIALVPILMLAFGYGFGVRVLVVVIQTFAIVNMNCCTGFLNVPQIRNELMFSFGATRVQRFAKVTFPSAIKDSFTGFKLATIFASTACIGFEYVGGNAGLGSRIITYSQYLKTTESFACIFYVICIGLVMYGLVSLIEKKVVKWQV